MNCRDFIILKSTPTRSIPIALDPVMDIDSIRIYSLLCHLSVEERLIDIGSIEEQLGGHFSHINIDKSLIRLELYRYISIDRVKNYRNITLYKSLNDIVKTLRDNKSYLKFVSNDEQFEYRDKLYAHQTQTFINDYLTICDICTTGTDENISSFCTTGTDENISSFCTTGTDENISSFCTTGTDENISSFCTTGTDENISSFCTTGTDENISSFCTTGTDENISSFCTTGTDENISSFCTTGTDENISSFCTTGTVSVNGQSGTTGFKNSDGDPDVTGLDSIQNSSDQIGQITGLAKVGLDNPRTGATNSHYSENLNATSSDFSGKLSAILLNSQKNTPEFNADFDQIKNNSLNINMLGWFCENLTEEGIDKNFSSMDDTHTPNINVSQSVSNLNNTYLPTDSTAVVNSTEEYSEKPKQKNNHLSSANHKNYSYDDLDWLSINLSTSNFIFDNFITRKISLGDAQTIITVIDHQYQSGLVIHSLSAFLNKLFQAANKGILYNPKNISSGSDPSVSKNKSQESAQLLHHHVTYLNFIKNNQLEIASTYLDERNLQWDGEKIIFKENSR